MMSCEVVLFYGNSGKSFSLYHWKLPEVQTGIFGRKATPLKSLIVHGLNHPNYHHDSTSLHASSSSKHLILTKTQLF